MSKGGITTCIALNRVIDTLVCPLKKKKDRKKKSSISQHCIGFCCKNIKFFYSQHHYIIKQTVLVGPGFLTRFGLRIPGQLDLVQTFKGRDLFIDCLWIFIFIYTVPVVLYN